MLKLTSLCTAPAASTGDNLSNVPIFTEKVEGKDALIRLGCTYLSYLIYREYEWTIVV